MHSFGWFWTCVLHLDIDSFLAWHSWVILHCSCSLQDLWEWINSWAALDPSWISNDGIVMWLSSNICIQCLHLSLGSWSAFAYSMCKCSHTFWHNMMLWFWVNEHSDLPSYCSQTTEYVWFIDHTCAVSLWEAIIHHVYLLDIFLFLWIYRDMSLNKALTNSFRVAQSNLAPALGLVI